MPPSENLPQDPQAVWQLVVHADELRKYSPNRDPEVALAQAEDTLRRALEAAEALPDAVAGTALAKQIRTRLADIGKARGANA
jgi:hypothetical protein